PGGVEVPLPADVDRPLSGPPGAECRRAVTREEERRLRDRDDGQTLLLRLEEGAETPQLLRRRCRCTFLRGDQRRLARERLERLVLDRAADRSEEHTSELQSRG